MIHISTMGLQIIEWHTTLHQTKVAAVDRDFILRIINSSVSLST